MRWAENLLRYKSITWIPTTASTNTSDTRIVGLPLARDAQPLPLPRDAVEVVVDVADDLLVSLLRKGEPEKHGKRVSGKTTLT